MLSQLEALRGAVDFLQRENAHLKSADLLKALPTLPRRRTYLHPLPSLIPASPASDDDDEVGPSTPGRETAANGEDDDVHRLECEATLLFREVGRFSASPKVVDLTAFGPPSPSSTKLRWLPRSKRPDAVLEARKKEGERLEGRVEVLKERAAQAWAAQARHRYGF